MVNHGYESFHPTIRELRRLREEPINQENAQNFLNYLRLQFPGGTWEQHENAKQEVNMFLTRLDTISSNWAQDIKNAIQNTNTQIGVLRADVTPQGGINISAFNPGNLESTASQIINSNIETRNNRNVFLYQNYINTVTPLTITVDGIMERETLEAIGNYVRETQVFLRALGAKNEDGTNLTIDGIIGPNTTRALTEYLGIGNLDVASLQVIETVTQELESLQRLDDRQLLARLQEVNNQLPERAQEKRRYISEFARRFAQRHIMVRVDENNIHRLSDNTGTTINIGLSDIDLQAIMLLLSIRSNNIEEDRNSLSENITNNIFDSVVREYDFKNGSRHWRVQDFIVSGSIITESEVQRNKQAAIGQIEGKITELEQVLSSAQTDIDRSNIRTQIQRLEIARMFVRSQNGAFSGESLALAQTISQDAQNLILALGGGENARNAVNGGSPAEIRRVLMANVPSFIIGGIFALLARMLPSPFKEIAYVIIGGIVGLGVFEDLQNRGVIPSGNGSPSGTNRPAVDSPGLNNLTDAMHEILTRAPRGLEDRHKSRYIDVVTKNNELRQIEERQKLDHMYLFLSQDHVFGQQEIDSINTEDQNNNDIWNHMSEYSKGRLQSLGVTTADLIIFIRTLKDTNSDTADRLMQDIFVVGQVTDVANLPNVTWVQGTQFETENRDINLFLSKLTGVSIGADESARGNSPRASVEEILSSAQPNILAWLGQSLAERTNLVGEQVPSSDTIQDIIEQLTALSFNGDDNTYLSGIIASYRTIKERLQLDEDISSYLSETSAVYTISGRAYSSMQDIVYWIQNLGEPMPISNRPLITTESIDEMIEKGENLKNRYGISEAQQSQIDIAIRNLRLYLIRTLDMESRDSNLTERDRENLRMQSDTVLASAIRANPELYTTTLDAMQVSLAPLKQEQTSTRAYLNLLSSHRRELVALQRLYRLDTGVDEFDRNSHTLYTEVFIRGILSNLTAHVSTKNTELTGFDTQNIMSFEELRNRERELDELSHQFVGRSLAIDTMTYFGIAEDYSFEFQGTRVMNLPALAARILEGVDGEAHDIGFDQNTLILKQRELVERRRTLEAELPIILTEISDNDLTNNERISYLTTEISGHYEEISSLSNENIKTIKLEELGRQVSEIINRMTSLLRDTDDTIEAITPLATAYANLTDTRVGNGGNESFEGALRNKEENIYREAVRNTTLEDVLNSSTGRLFIEQLRLFRENTNIVTVLRDNPNALDATTVGELLDILDNFSNRNVGSDEDNRIFRETIANLRNNIYRTLTGTIDSLIHSWILERYDSIESFLQGLT